MEKEFRYPYTTVFQFTVQVDDSGQPYAERTRKGRIAWILLGLLIAGVSGWYVVSRGGLDGSLRQVAIPAGIGLFALVGVVVEPILGSDRSRVFEDGDRYYIQILPCSRWYLLAFGAGAIATGTLAFLRVRVPGLVRSAGPAPGSDSARLAEAIPFGEFVVMFVAVVVAVVALQKALEGRLLIVPK